MSKDTIKEHGKDTICGSGISPTAKNSIMILNEDSSMSGKIVGLGMGSGGAEVGSVGLDMEAQLTKKGKWDSYLNKLMEGVNGPSQSNDDDKPNNQEVADSENTSNLKIVGKWKRISTDKRKVEAKLELGEKSGKRKNETLLSNERKRPKDERLCLEPEVGKRISHVLIDNGSTVEIEEQGMDTVGPKGFIKEIKAKESVLESDKVGKIDSMVTMDVISSLSKEDDRLELLASRSRNWVEKILANIDRCGRRLKAWNMRKRRDLRTEIQKRREELKKATDSDFPDSWMIVNKLEGELNEVMDVEERYWCQRAKVEWLKYGDRNTRFFHSKASARNVINRIKGLTDEDGLWKVTIAEVERIACQYFGKLFQTCNPSNGDLIKVWDGMNGKNCDQLVHMLNMAFTDEEVRKAVFDMSLVKALRYIRGARFFGNSNVDVDPVVAIDIGQPTFEVAIVKNKTNPTSISTFRARLVGQGYNLYVTSDLATDVTINVGEVKFYLHKV
ncbi:hypothetical protein LWI28_008761 [Acer negundo]|uniref:Uncharacterized protein n=1 Tax=Acer negundo TaxID=4023 RepID=A0AAD5JI67_ACENE|nr:hypothetical protein LWI28_008761 [Acer negundo]